MSIRGIGCDVIDLGIDMPDDRFVEAGTKTEPDIVALSALLTATMPSFKTVIASPAKADLRDSATARIGGASFMRGYAGDADEDAALCRRLVDRLESER